MDEALTELEMLVMDTLSVVFYDESDSCLFGIVEICNKDTCIGFLFTITKETDPETPIIIGELYVSVDKTYGTLKVTFPVAMIAIVPMYDFSN